MHVHRRDLTAFALLSTTLALNALAADQDAGAVYPQRPVTLVIGYPPGGNTDTLARLLVRHMGEELGQKIIIDYRPGATSNIGAQSVARATPDGYTLYLSGRPNTIHKTMYGHLEYDFARDLVPIGLVATIPNVMVAGVHAPIATVQDLVQLARTYPGAMTCASSGVGSTPHLLCELLQQETDTDMLHVPYQGAAQALTDVMGGRIDVQITSVSATLPHIQSGKIKPIVVLSRLRVPTMPDVPTIAEAGLPGLASDAWFGLMAPTGTPSHVIEKLNRSINVAVMTSGLHDAMVQLAYAPPLQPNTAAAFEDLITKETEQWTAILRRRNIKPLN